MKSWKLQFSNSKSPAGNNLISIMIKVLFDGVIMPYILNIDGLYDALQTEGKAPFFTCECGDFGCGGYYIDVHHTEEGMRLLNRYDPLDESIIIEEYSNFIDWEDVYMIFKEAVDYIIEIRDRYKNHEVCVGIYGTNLLDKVDEYYNAIDVLRLRFD